MASTVRLTAARKAVFLEVLGTTANVTQACAIAGLACRSVYHWRTHDEGFAQAWTEALERGIDALEDVALRRATEGREEPVFYKGEKCGSVRKPSDALLMFMLKARRPEIYKDRAAVEHSTKDGTPLVPVINLTIGKPDTKTDHLDRPDPGPAPGRGLAQPGG